MWSLHNYKAHIKGIPFNSNMFPLSTSIKRITSQIITITAIDGECTNTTELRKHLKALFSRRIKLKDCLPFQYIVLCVFVGGGGGEQGVYILLPSKIMVIVTYH